MIWSLIDVNRSVGGIYCLPNFCTTLAYEQTMLCYLPKTLSYAVNDNDVKLSFYLLLLSLTAFMACYGR